MFFKSTIVVLLVLVYTDERQAASVMTNYSTTSSATTVASTQATTGPTPTTLKNKTSAASQCVPVPGPAAHRCHRYYNHSVGICNSSISADGWIFANRKQQIEYEKRMRTVRIKRAFFVSMNMPDPSVLLRNRCFQIVHDMYCHHYFPRCDMTSNYTQPQPICREACVMLNFKCKSEWITLMKNYPGVTWSAQDDIGETMDQHEAFSLYIAKNILMKCDGLPTMNGPDVPECYIAPELLHDKTAIEIMNGSSYDCFYGNGYAYRGNVSVTKSGYECQSWSEQCPHNHSRTPDNYRELTGAGNACRNPGHQAPRGPWCYTTNPDVRWEYCNITRCPYDVSQGYVITLSDAQKYNHTLNAQGKVQVRSSGAQKSSGSKSQGGKKKKAKKGKKRSGSRKRSKSRKGSKSSRSRSRSRRGRKRSRKNSKTKKSSKSNNG